VLAEDDAQREKLADAAGFRHVLTFADLEELADRGRRHRAAHPDALAAAVEAVGEDDLYTYIYTSGTSGPPKACMIRHRNYYEMASSVAAVEGLVGPEDVVLLYLPLAHSFGRLLHLIGTLVGFATAFCPDPYAVADVLPEVRPTLLPSVPRLFEKVHAAALQRFAAQRGPRRTLVDWALRLGRKTGRYRIEGRPLPPRLAVQHRLADRLVYSKLKSRLGGRLRYAVSGGAPLSPEIAEFFHSLDVVVLEGYGLTECTAAATVNRPRRYRLGTVGLPLPGFEVKTAADGELLVRSETVFAGYLDDAESTRLVLDPDGWLRTGDIGEIDRDGFVRITDRKKDVIVTAGGKKVAPQNLENELKTSPLVSQALVVGDRRPYVTALVTVDPDEATGHDDVVASVQAVVDEVNRGRTRYEQIKRFAVLPRDFSADEGEVTPTLKLRRRVCEAHFADEIEALYTSAAPAETLDKS
jgi:long-chain acyl-CoA synthetase